MTVDVLINGSLQRAVRNGFTVSPGQRRRLLQVPGVPTGGSGKRLCGTDHNHGPIQEKHSGACFAQRLPADSAQFLAARYLTSDDEK